MGYWPPERVLFISFHSSWTESETMIRDGVYVCGGGGQGQGTLDIPICGIWRAARIEDRSEDGGPDSHITPFKAGQSPPSRATCLSHRVIGLAHLVLLMGSLSLQLGRGNSLPFSGQLRATVLCLSAFSLS